MRWKQAYDIKPWIGTRIDVDPNRERPTQKIKPKLVKRVPKNIPAKKSRNLTIDGLTKETAKN